MYVEILRVARIHGAKGGKLMVLVPWQSLGEIIRDVVVARDMLDAELVALDTVLQPMKTHVDAFGRRGVIVRLARPTAISLSQRRRVGGWG